MPTPLSRTFLFTVLTLSLALLLGTGCATHRDIQQGRAALHADQPLLARAHLQRALERSPHRANDPDFVRDLRQARRDAAVVEGQTALRRQDTDRAIERFTAALQHHPGWGPAAAGLNDAHAAAADALYEQASHAADRGDLDAARDALDAALSHRNDHAAAQASLQSLDRATADAPAAFRHALQQADAGAWDDALASLDACVAAQPGFFPARAARPATRDRAAADILDRGRAALAAGRLDDAESLIQRTRTYRPQHEAIEPTLGRVDLARARAAKGLPGAALLAYRRAKRHFDGHPGADADAATAGMNRTTQVLLDGQRLTLELAFEAGTAPQFADRFRKSLLKRRSAALALGPGGHAVSVRLGRLDLPPVTVTTQKKTHAYEVIEHVPNPIIPDLQHRIAGSEHNLDRLSHRASSLRSQLACLADDDARRHHLKTQINSVQHDLRQSRSHQSSLINQLGSAAATIPRPRTEHLPYLRLNHHRKAALDAELTLDDGTPTSITARYTEDGTSIQGARPDLGLRPRTANLKDDHAVAQELYRWAADRLVRKLIKTLVNRRIEVLRAEAARLAGIPQPDASREARVAAAVLLGAIDHAGSTRALDAE